jgi:PTS system nitrogen regulatory IIA component
MPSSIASYIKKEHLFFLGGRSKEEVISQLVHHLFLKGVIVEEERFLEAILLREELTSTGIGKGIALPHAKLPIYKEFFIAIGILKEAIEWDAIDGAPVRLVFLIGGPDNAPTAYLQLLSDLTFALKDEGRRKKLLQLSSQEEIIGLFE